MKTHQFSILLVLLFLFLPSVVFSQIKLPKVFGDHMVLQQGKKVNIWGRSEPGGNDYCKISEAIKKSKGR
ncbi:MAG: hypothetical protein LBV74_08565 [Tannerella sp.]|nr:hypothetical protein [Tannerella sp.]